MSTTYCTQCGVEGDPIPAVGKDDDGDPACGRHATRIATRITVPGNGKSTPELCFCGREARHRGRHKGVYDSKPEPPKALPAPSKPRADITARTLRESDVEAVFPTADSFVGDSIIRMKMRGGEIALMFKGDTLSLLADREDMRFVRSLVVTMQRYGQERTFVSTNAKRTGKYFDIKMDEGFIDDMIEMMESKDKAEMLNYLWTREKAGGDAA